MATELFNPYDPALIDDPYPTFRKLRDHDGLYYSEEQRFFAVSRFEDVMEVLLKPAVFSSAAGISIEEQAAGEMPPMMIQMDPPRHDQMRALVNRAFTPRRINGLEGRIRDITRELVADIAAKGQGDLVPDLAVALPTIVIAELLGVPVEDRAEFRAWSDAIVDVAADPTNRSNALEAAMNLFVYFEKLLPERAKDLRDDMMSALIVAEIDGQRLSHEELVGFCFLLLLAGNETTTNLISNGAVWLHRHPDQRAWLVEDPERIGQAMEEVLRYDAPVQGLARMATEDTVVAGTKISAGDRLLILFGSANRDEREFDDPDSFDVRRKPDRHVAFGRGIHFCLGAHLARMEARIAFEELLAAMPEYEITIDQVHWNHLIPVRGVVSIPVDPGRVPAHA